MTVIKDSMSNTMSSILCTAVNQDFGGVGASGMGHFHGRERFKTFSHAKSVFHQGFLNLQKLSGTLPPYGDKVDGLLDRMIRK